MADNGPPPNLRVAPTDQRDCGDCAHYKTTGECVKYPPACVAEGWLCNGFDPKSGSGVFKGRTLAEARDEAYVRVRAHTRRKQQT